MESLSSAYRYSPLDMTRKEIRVLTVHQRTQHIPHTDPVRCTVQHVSLQDEPRPEYETISYVWGDPGNTSTVLLNGQETTVPMCAEEALNCMRLHHGARDRNLWIDAICIDQGNLDERAALVRIMGDIYRDATANLIHVGHDDGTIGRAWLDFRHLNDEIHRETDNLKTFLKDVLDEENAEWRRTDNPLITKIDPPALVSFYSRPWFQRLWVIQELVLPPRSLFICGPFHVDALTVLRASIWLNYKALSLPRDLQECQGRHNSVDLAYLAYVTGLLESRRPQKPSLRYLLALTTRFGTSDPRDQVFAIFDLLKSSSPDTSEYIDLIVPDYTKPVAQIFRDATIFSILDSKSLSIWRNVYHRGDATLDIGEHSSWVPQWYRTFDYREDVYRLPETFNAALGSEVSTSILGSPLLSTTRELPVQGFRVAGITQTTDNMTREILSQVEGLRTTFHSIDEIVASVIGSAKSSAESVLARTLVVGRDPKGYSELRSALQQGKSLPTQYSDAENEDPEAITGLARRYYDLIFHYCSNRRFFGAGSGCVGVAASALQVDDVVAILYGAPWPVILRPLENGFQYVSQCYIDGIMQGEAVQERRRTGLADETFTLL